MLISIVTVTFNNLPGLRETLDSIVSQNVCHAELLEWIVIDGGSTDGTLHFLENLNLDFPVSFKSERDKGIFDAMNKGIRFSSGKYLYFLNSGDKLASESVLAKLIIHLSSESFQLISGLVRMHYKSDSKDSDLMPWVCHQAVFIPRLLIEKYMYDDTLTFFGDLDLWKRLNKDGNFNVLRFQLIVSEFELGGIGNSPKHIFSRLRERQMIGVRFDDKTPYVFRVGYSLLLYAIYKFAGKDAYYRYLLR